MGIVEALWLHGQKVIVTVGEVHGADVDMYMTITSKSGNLCDDGMGKMVDMDVTLEPVALTLMQKTSQGTISAVRIPLRIPPLLSMCRAGRLNLDDMVTRQYRLEQINEGYQDMLEGRNIRGVICFTDADR